jgi:hypothetical protein
MRIIVCFLLSFALSVALFQAAQAQEVKTPDSSPSTAAAPIGEIPLGTTNPETTAADDAAIRELATTLRKELSGTDEELAGLAREIAARLIPSFNHDLDIARIDHRRRRMEAARLAVLEMAEQAASDRRELMEQMQSELEAIKKQFADDDPTICEAEQVAVVKAYRDQLQALSDREDQCHQKAEETSRALVALRRDKVGRERARWLAEKTPDQTAASASPVPRLEWVQSESKPAIGNEQTTSSEKRESLAEVLASIEKLDKPK